MKIKNLFNAKGFTLTEVIIGGAIVAITGLGVMQGLEISSNSNKLKKRTVQADRLHKRIVGQLAIRATCKATFSATNTPATVAGYSVNGSVIGGEFNEIGINSVTIPAVAASPNVQTGQLVIVYNLDVNNRGVSGGGVATKSTTIYIRRTASNFECSTAFLDEESYRQNCIGSGGTWDSDAQTCNINTGSGNEILSAINASKQKCQNLIGGTAITAGGGQTCDADEAMCEGIGGCWNWVHPITGTNYPGCNFETAGTWGWINTVPPTTWSDCSSCNRSRQQECQVGMCDDVGTCTGAGPQPAPEVYPAGVGGSLETPFASGGSPVGAGVIGAFNPIPTCAIYGQYTIPSPGVYSCAIADGFQSGNSCYEDISCSGSACGANCDPNSATNSPRPSLSGTQSFGNISTSLNSSNGRRYDTAAVCGPAGTWPATIPGGAWGACSSCSQTATISCNLGSCGGTCPTAAFNIGSANCVPNGTGTSATCTQACGTVPGTWTTPSYPACPAAQTATVTCTPGACGGDCSSVTPPTGCDGSGNCTGSACPPSTCVNGASCTSDAACVTGTCTGASSSTTCSDFYAGSSIENCSSANATAQLPLCTASCGGDTNCSCQCLGGFSYGPMDSCSASLGWPSPYVGGFHIRKFITSSTAGTCSCPVTSCTVGASCTTDPSCGAGGTCNGYTPAGPNYAGTCWGDPFACGGGPTGPDYSEGTPCNSGADCPARVVDSYGDCGGYEPPGTEQTGTDYYCNTGFPITGTEVLGSCSCGCTPTTSCSAIAAGICTGVDAGNDSCGNDCGNGTKTDGACAGGTCTVGANCNSDASCGTGGNCNIASCNIGDSCVNDSNCTGGSSCVNIPITTPGDCSISVTGCVGSSYSVGPGGCTPGSSCNIVECGQYGNVNECVDCSCGGDVTTDNYTCQNCPAIGTCSCSASCTPNCSNASNVCAGVQFSDANGCGTNNCTGTKNPAYGTWNYGGWGACIGSNDSTWGTRTRTATCSGTSNGCGVVCPGTPATTEYCMDVGQYYNESIACSGWNVCCTFDTPQPWSSSGTLLECRTVDGFQDAWCDNAPEGGASLYECRLAVPVPAYP
ncbi:MAG: hypothetical protein JNM93_00710 [Bacteriovoracaceae bacterium]|nr:hypothetical protein [Bacteriovoracaceae bacterium]